MAKFKRFDNQVALQLDAKLSSGTATYHVGDLVEYIASTKVASKITTIANIETALGAGHKVILISQGDAVTEKTGTGYKSYAISDTVAMSTTEKTLVGYDVTDSTNIEL